jgi:hypothetical protein
MSYFSPPFWDELITHPLRNLSFLEVEQLPTVLYVGELFKDALLTQFVKVWM